MRVGMVAIVLAAAGCAGMERGRMADSGSVAGHWVGSVERNGWERPLALDISAGEGRWRARWLLPKACSALTTTDTEVRGDEVSFTVSNLRFAGHLRGNELHGTVVDLASREPDGEFLLARDEPANF